jgi:thiol:disulfide interchange protein DsbD
MRSLLCLLALPALLFAETPKPGDKDFDPFADYNRANRKVEPVQPPPPVNGKEPATAKLISFDVKLDPTTVRRGEVIKLTITGKPIEGYHTYPLTVRTPKQEPGQLNKLTIQGDTFQLVGQPQETEAEAALEDKVVLLEHNKAFTWTLNLLVDPKAKPGPAELAFSIKLQVCKTSCTPGTHEFRIPVTISDTQPVPVPEGIKSELGQPIKITVKEPPADLEAQTKDNEGLLGFMLQGVFWGAVSLLTPCVFPMIPITVSFFLKQSENKNHRPFLMAMVYSATIVIVLTIAAVALLSVFRALITYSLTQFALGGLFLFFALSLFGMYEIELPSGLARFTSSREGSGLTGTIFMALTFTIISFACVAPFLGGFGGTGVKEDLGFTKILLGGLAFSATFASPFVVLALFPTLLKKMPKSGTWLNSVKVVMGFLELAAALKFLRTGELRISGEATFLTYNFVMGFYIALCFFCAIYLLSLFRLPYDSPLDSLSAPRMLFALLFAAIGLYLLPSMFVADEKGRLQRPGGSVFAWLDSFLLSENKEPWIRTLPKGIAEAKKYPGSRIFIDFTGVTCTNCKYNEDNIFSDDRVRALLEQYVRVKMYTDIVPEFMYEDDVTTSEQEEEAAENLKFQRDKFKDERLPLYVIVEPTDDGGWREVARYDEGKINSKKAFMKFLRNNAGTPPK